MSHLKVRKAIWRIRDACVVREFPIAVRSMRRRFDCRGDADVGAERPFALTAGNRPLDENGTRYRHRQQTGPSAVAITSATEHEMANSRLARRPHVNIRRRSFARRCEPATQPSAAEIVGLACLGQGPTPPVRVMWSGLLRRTIRREAEQISSLHWALRGHCRQRVLVAGDGEAIATKAIAERRRRAAPAIVAFRASIARPLPLLPLPPTKALPVLLGRTSSLPGSFAKAVAIQEHRANTFRRTHSANDHRPWIKPPVVIDTIADRAYVRDENLYEAMPRIVAQMRPPDVLRNDFAMCTEHAFTAPQGSVAIQQAPNNLGESSAARDGAVQTRNSRTLRFLEERDGQPH
jgi:hypothetical protein